MAANGTQGAPARRLPGIARAGDLAAKDATLEERLPELLVVPADELDARELPVADLPDEPPLGVALHLPLPRVLDAEPARLDVIDGG